MARMNVLMVLLLAALVHPGATALGAGPEIFSLGPDHGPAGTPILLRGKHLEKTRKVFFSAGPVVKLAHFKVLTDQEIEVIAPEFFLPDTKATVAVLTDHGITVGMPPDAETVDASSTSNSRSANFSLVKQGGLLGAAQGVTVIEDGGVVQGTTSRAGMLFIQKGGILLRFDNAEGVVFEEPGAIFTPPPPDVVRRMPGRGAARVRVDRISASRGIQPFLFEAPDQAPGPADSAPRIERIQPTVATYGAILEVQGSGFLGTTEVFFSKALSTSPTAAGFQVISDTLLKVEVPPSADGSAVPRPPIDLVHRNQKWKWPFAPLRPHFLIVVNPKGATVTVPASPSGRPLREVYDLFQYVGPGQISTRVNGIYFVASQGLASQSAGIFFLKNGAMLATTSAAAVFMEPQAEIPSTLDNPRKCHHVESVSASPLSKMLVILTPYY